MVTRRWMALAVALVACRSSAPSRPSECSVEADCEPGQHCLLQGRDGVGRCVDVPGRDDGESVRLLVDWPRTDVLLVVDDGPGTAALQARLVTSLDALVQRAALYGNDLRVAVTTTSMSDGPCLTSHQATRGMFRATSCLDRLEEFVTSDLDAQWLCTDRCPYTTEALGLSADQPWLELRRLPAGVDPVDALACLVPQGISGCEYAEPLAAVELASRRASQLDEPEEGFFRYADTGEVVVVTDGADCSLSETGIDAFDPAGERAHWSDPLAEAPTPAVCWNAGVECSGDPSGYDDCVAVDRRVDGRPANGGESAVLVPLADYEWPMGDDLRLHVIGGVPVDGGPPSYSAAGDPAGLLEHGIDPGCSDAELSALPPVRLRDMAVGSASACAPDYRGALREVLPTDTLCVRPCDAAALEVTYEALGQAPTPVGPCEVVGGVFAAPAGEPACYGLVPEADGCGDEPGRSTGLLLWSARVDDVAAFLLTPNPWLEGPEVECPG